MLNLPWGERGDLVFLAVYAPNDGGENTRLWRELTKQWRERNLPKIDILLGDFNLVEDALDRKPPRADSTVAVEALQEFKATSLLMDGWQQTFPTKQFFTWTSGSTESRLDRIYMRKEVLKFSTEWRIHPAPFPTDHNIVSCSILNPEQPHIGKGRWAIPRMVIENKEFITNVVSRGTVLQEALTPPLNERQSLQMMYKEFKADIIALAKKYACKMASMLDKKIKEKETQLEETLNNNEHLTIDRNIQSAIQKGKLRSLVQLRHKTKKMNIAIRNNWKEKPSVNIRLSLTRPKLHTQQSTHCEMTRILVQNLYRNQPKWQR
ncbi:hypothetical protein M422DRAFT_258194 [Sphaerobolus stellatus SS14]|uniref:Unplaced genomic scaffold SPHSTscaffold_80, whole genome shotgun sequence n=1 Tax=Sphaerobolus stellatus (strain SS14) TaxID=990650 RepID=A0A0C9UVZ1_SPHS4|nr:hypothetical protein M422DRAFT_258194 [Sphaerobolus stellatus SS14]